MENRFVRLTSDRRIRSPNVHYATRQHLEYQYVQLLLSSEHHLTNRLAAKVNKAEFHHYKTIESSRLRPRFSCGWMSAVTVAACHMLRM